MKRHAIADAIAKKESKQVNYMNNKNGDTCIGWDDNKSMETRNSIEFVYIQSSRTEQASEKTMTPAL